MHIKIRMHAYHAFKSYVLTFLRKIPKYIVYPNLLEVKKFYKKKFFQCAISGNLIAVEKEMNIT